MKRILLLFLLIGSFVYSQNLCEECVEQNGFYCGDDPANWTQYSPNGCVPNGLNGLFYLNDGWEDCVDASDEEDAVPTTLADCQSYVEPCDTVYVDIPVIEYVYLTDTIPFYIYETILQLDTIYLTEYITQIVIDTVEVEVFVPEYIYVTDTLWMDGALDTMYVDVIDTLEIEVVVLDTIVETEYVEFFTTDTIIEYVDVVTTEYIDCDTGLPCSSNIPEIIEQSKKDDRMYNLLGQAIREPNGLYVEGGKVKYKLK
tara:strand:+ start:712 stop:1482 length:771 start_codon:yes stop_codon:yes gene_type:complete